MNQTMPTITYVECDGRERAVDVESGISVMQAALNHGVRGIVADCGGACACATCHVHVEDAWVDKLPEKSEIEEALLETLVELQPNSRLSCQIKVTDDLNGLIVKVPAQQG